MVTIWDAETSQSILKFEEHDKRCWTVEYCRCVDNMHLIASGSDDGAVKIWSESGISMGGGNRSVMEIQMRANVCCIAWSPTPPHTISPSAVPIIKYAVRFTTSARTVIYAQLA